MTEYPDWVTAEYDDLRAWDWDAVEETRDALRCDLGCEVVDNLSPAQVMWAAAELWFPKKKPLESS